MLSIVVTILTDGSFVLPFSHLRNVLSVRFHVLHLLTFCTRMHSLTKVRKLVKQIALPRRTTIVFFFWNWKLLNILPSLLTTMAFKMIVVLSGILLVSDHIFQQLRRKNSAHIYFSGFRIRLPIKGLKCCEALRVKSFEKSIFCWEKKSVAPFER